MSRDLTLGHKKNPKVKKIIHTDGTIEYLPEDEERKRHAKPNPIPKLDR